MWFNYKLDPLVIYNLICNNFTFPTSALESAYTQWKTCFLNFFFYDLLLSCEPFAHNRCKQNWEDKLRKNTSDELWEDVLESIQ